MTPGYCNRIKNKHFVLQPYSQIADLALTKKLFLNLLIQFYLNNVTNVHQ